MPAHDKSELQLLRVRDAAKDVLSGMRVEDAAEKHGISKGYLYHYLRLRFDKSLWKHKNRKRGKNFNAQLEVWMDCKRRFENKASLSEIGRLYGVSRQRVHQMIKKAKAYEEENRNG